MIRRARAWEQRVVRTQAAVRAWAARRAVTALRAQRRRAVTALTLQCWVRAPRPHVRVCGCVRTRDSVCMIPCCSGGSVRLAVC